MSTAAHETSSLANARSMIHGMWRPLTASAYRPPAPIAGRASAAISSAAFCAREPASSKTSSCIGFFSRGWVVPASRRGNFFAGLSPGAFVVFLNWSAGFQRGIHDSPCLFDVIFACKQSGVARHGVAEDALVSVHFFRARATAGDDLHWFVFHLLPKAHYSRTHGDGHLRTDTEAQVVLGYITPDGGRRLAKSSDDFGASDRQILSGADVERHAFPAP